MSLRRCSLLTLLALSLCARNSGAHELGFNIHQSSTVGPNATKDAGLKWVRIDMNWDLAQPADAVPDWTVLDQVVNAAQAKGLSVLAVIGYTPAWASAQNNEPSTHQNDLPIAGKYDAFVSLAVNHFKDRVTHYELWNEPNLTQFFEGTPQQYVDLILKPGADAVHAACPACKVVSGGLSSLASSMYDTWLDTMLKLAAAKIDIVNGHVYSSFTEDDSGAGTTSDSFLNRLESHRKIVLGGITVFEGRLSFKEVMDNNACTKPFWLTETGFEASAGAAADLANQTRYYRRVLEKASVRPWWTTTIFYEGFDAMVSSSHFGAVTDTGAGAYAKKPVFDFLKLAVQGLAFGGTNPACSDALDNDNDGKIDFPDDSDCFDPTSATEGVLAIPDLSGLGGSGDGGTTTPPDGSVTGGGNPGGSGGSGASPPRKGCSFGGDAPIPIALCMIFLIVALATRRTA